MSQYVTSMRNEAFSSLPGGHKAWNSSAVFGLNEVANHVRAWRMRGSRRARKA
jgi:hypothetical protein